MYINTVMSSMCEVNFSDILMNAAFHFIFFLFLLFGLSLLALLLVDCWVSDCHDS